MCVGVPERPSTHSKTNGTLPFTQEALRESYEHKKTDILPTLRKFGLARERANTVTMHSVTSLHSIPQDLEMNLVA